MSAETDAPIPDLAPYSSSSHGHLAQFYETDQFLYDMLDKFVGDALECDIATIVVATREHASGLERRLEKRDINVEAVARQGQLVMLDAESMVDRIMVDGSPDTSQFLEIIGDVIDTARQRWPAVRVFGEMVALTAARDDLESTIEIERLWNQLLERKEFFLYCAYPLDSFTRPGTERRLHELCSLHSTVVPAESYTELSEPEDRLRAITLLQHKANLLEREVRQRVLAEERLQAALDAERAAREEAEAALRMRDEFVSVAAHELKTPLTSLLGHAQLMSRHWWNNRSNDSGRITVALDAVSRQADKLSRLVTQLLDVSRLDGGKLPIERELVDMSALVREAVRSTYSGGNRHSIVFSAPDSLFIDVDPIRIEQVVTNLLSNAIRFSPDGGTIAVTLSVPRDGTLELSIRDHGLGIPPDKRDRIFERFYQAHHHQSRSGMGLGLYISRQIVEQHGGEVKVEFPSDGGTCFVVRLPLE